ncbi:MAG: efflux RND transporter periplasmic adaptor subunit [Candidatus Omnitrophota bacterium]
MKTKVIVLILLCGLMTMALYGTKATAENPEINYYTCGMHPSVKVSLEDYNRGNQSCPICHMNLTPVYQEARVMPSKKERKVLFYRNPMNPSITSKVPAKDEMGMDYIPVYEEGAQETSTPQAYIERVMVKADQAKLAGIQTEPVRKYHLFKEIRTVGTVAYDPEMAVAQDEFISAVATLEKIRQGKISDITERAEALVKSSERKLRLLGLNQSQIDELAQTRSIQENLILPEEKMWVYAEVYEYDLPWISEGNKITMTTASLPGEEFYGVVTSVNPVVNPKTRSVTLRAQVDNPDLKLKPDMYVDVVVKSMYKGPQGEEMILAVPKEAVLDTGTRKIVWVDDGNGTYEGREVIIGPEAIAMTEKKEMEAYPVLQGLQEGDQVVTKGNFLIDSQSQITGVAASAYSGALDSQKEKIAPAHQH